MLWYWLLVGLVCLVGYGCVNEIIKVDLILYGNKFYMKILNSFLEFV